MDRWTTADIVTLGCHLRLPRPSGSLLEVHACIIPLGMQVQSPIGRVEIMKHLKVEHMH